MGRRVPISAGGGTGGSGDPHNLGWYTTGVALNNAFPTANDGDWAIVGSTDSVWIWDTDTTTWVDSGEQALGDMVKSVYDSDDDGVVDAADSVPWSGITDKPSLFAPTSHNNTSHSETYITESGVTYENLNANGDVGTTSGTVCAGDDSRLSDSRTPTSHGNEAHSSTFLTGIDIHGATPETAIADNDEILIYDTSASANRRMTRSNFLSGVPGYVDDIIGIKWNSSSSSPTLIRVDEDLQEISAGYINWPKYFDRHPIWGQMWRCNLTADGDATFGTNARGDALTLTNDYTMVRIPRVYHRFVYDDGDWYWLVSPEPSSGFDLHPAFYQRGHSASPVDQVYVGAYTAGANGGTTANNGTYNTLYATNWTGLKLTSKAGVKNLTGSGSSGTMAQFETAGNAIGTGWGLTNFHTLCLLQQLFYTEYASFDSQSKLGLGRTNASNTAAALTGTYLNQVGEGAGTDIQSLLASNGTYGSTTNDYHSVVWRGIENLWGNIWQRIPGYNTTDTSHRILKRDGTGTIADEMASGSYEEITSPIPLNGVNNISGTDAGAYCHGYVSAFARDSSNVLGPMFVPGALAGASNTYLTDYAYSHQSGKSQTGVLRAGGGWNDGLDAGIGYRASLNGAANVFASVGGRLEFIG